MDADERLVVMLEARISEFEKRMAKAEGTGVRTYGSLSRNSRLATAQMERDAMTAAARVNAAMAGVGSGIGNFAKGFAGGLLVLSIDKIAGAARNAIASMADLADVAARVGMGVEDLQGLQYGLKLAGVDADAAAGALEKFTDALGDAAAGSGALYDRMTAAGIALTDSNGAMRDTAALLRDYADAVQAAPDPAARMAMVTDAFGRGGKAMVLAMSEGSAGIDQMIGQAQAAGVVIDQDLIAKAAALDDKFDELGAVISSTFKSGTVYVAEFLGVLTRLDDFFPDDAAAANILGKGLADALASNQSALEKSKADLVDLAHLYDDLQQTVTVAAGTISNEIPYLLEIGADDLALQLSDVTGEMDLLIAQVKAGKVPADQLGGEMDKLVQKAADALAEANKIDGVNLNNAVDAVGGVSDALAIAVAFSLDLLGNIKAAAGIAVSSGGGMEDDARGRVIATSPLAPTSSPRPRAAPALLGETGASSGARSSGGGGGNNRIDALLRDLQTEREAVTAWYSESAALLQTATDAQLAAYGGRHGAIERLEAEHQDRLRGLRDLGATDTLGKAGAVFGALATITAGGNDRLLKAQQTFAAAEALINTYRAQAQVLANPALSFWAKLPAMAAIGAAGFGLVRAIGGGGASSVAGYSGGSGGSESAASDTAAASPAPMRFLIDGVSPEKLYTGQALIDLTTAIQKEMGNRGLIWEFAT